MKKMNKKSLIILMLILIGIHYWSYSQDQSMNLSKETLLQLVKISEQNKILKNELNITYNKINFCQELNSKVELTSEQLRQLVISNKTYIDKLYDSNENLFKETLKINEEKEIVKAKVNRLENRLKRRLGLGLATGCFLDSNLKPIISIGVSINYTLIRLF